MICTEVSQQLPEYVQGRLTADQRTFIAEHLTHCPVCSGELDDLRRIAQAIEKYGAVLFEDHLEAELLVSYAGEQEALDPTQRENVERHLTLCDTCRREREVLLRVNKSLPMAELPIAPDALAGNARESEDEVETVAPSLWGARVRLFFEVRWHTWALAAVVLVAISSLLTVFYFQQQPPGDIHRGGRQAQVVEARYPLGLVTEPPDTIAWEPVPEAKTYRVGLYNSAMEKAWQSPRVVTNQVELPPDVRSRLSSGQRYFWQVTVEVDRGKVMKSRLFEFSLK